MNRFAAILLGIGASISMFGGGQAAASAEAFAAITEPVKAEQSFATPTESTGKTFLPPLEKTLTVSTDQPFPLAVAPEESTTEVFEQSLEQSQFEAQVVEQVDRVLLQATQSATTPEVPETQVMRQVDQSAPQPAQSATTQAQVNQPSTPTVESSVTHPLESQVASTPAGTEGYRGVPAPPATQKNTKIDTDTDNAQFNPPTGYREIASGVYVPAKYVEAQIHTAPVVTASSSTEISASPSFPSASVPVSLPPQLQQASVKQFGQFGFIFPFASAVPITSNFGWRIHPVTGTQRFHSGIDLGAPHGTAVLAAHSGRVVFAGWRGGYGNTIILQSLDGKTRTLYAHLSQLHVEADETVRIGQIVGAVGSTGLSTGPHLHFEIQKPTAQGWVATDLNQFVRSLLASGSFANRLNQQTTASFNFPQPVTSATSPEIRVGLLENVAAVKLASSTPAWILDSRGRPLAWIPSMQNFVTTTKGSGVQMGAKQMPAVLFIQPAQNGAVSVGGKWYRGKMMVVARPQGLTIVNWIDIETYLYSVVGAEAYPNWGQDALKAQAVAARSYALRFRYQPANDLYDIGSDTRYQAYEGVATEFSTTYQAVNATRGQILVDHAGQVLLAEYASTQQITNEAHGGFGMSQWGAAEMAQQGHSYLHILGKYYPGASLSVLAVR
jgi:murein DD-endopeptidase MepM/ murein hydrolase activator NlpD